MIQFQDKISLAEKIKKGEKISLNLGGGQKKQLGLINVDHLDLPEVDVVADLEAGLCFLPDNSVEEIYSNSFLEHIDNLEFLLGEIYRVLKPKSPAYFFVPHFSNPYFYSDYTHKRFFGLYSFYYFSRDQSRLKRQVPVFYNNIDFQIVEQKLIFASPFFVCNILKKIFGWIINRSVWLQEFYEAHLTGLISCYGIDIVLRVMK